MNHSQRKGRQECLFAPPPQIRLGPELRQAVLPALAKLIAAVLREPSRGPREGVPCDES